MFGIKIDFYLAWYYTSWYSISNYWHLLEISVITFSLIINIQKANLFGLVRETSAELFS